VTESSGRGTSSGTDEQFTTAPGGIRLCHQSFGDPDDPTVLLIMGLGLSMDWWREDFCAALADRGFHVVRFDNRDVGRSTHMNGPGISARGFLTRRARPVYTLGHMADDAAGLSRRWTGAARTWSAPRSGRRSRRRWRSATRRGRCR
jgi:pimeloyl-ACP methyl ester carboxylesterase